MLVYDPISMTRLLVDKRCRRATFTVERVNRRSVDIGDYWRQMEEAEKIEFEERRKKGDMSWDTWKGHMDEKDRRYYMLSSFGNFGRIKVVAWEKRFWRGWRKIGERKATYNG